VIISLKSFTMSVSGIIANPSGATLPHHTFYLLFALLHALPLTAQQSRPDSLLLQTVVIQATRTGEGSPVPHTNIGAEAIARTYHAQDIPFLLSNVPSLVETSDAGAGIGYTGLRIRGSDQTRINVTINGIPLNDAESQNVFWVDLPDLAASAAEIQVQRGVGASTNGAGAFGGTINLDLSRVQAEPFASLTNTLGSFNTRKHSLYTGTGLLGGRFAFTGRLSTLSSDGYVDRATARLQSAHLSGAYVDERQSLQFHLLSGHEKTYQAWFGLPAQYLDDPALRRYNPAGTERPGSPYPEEVDDYGQQHYLLHYKRFLKQGLYLQLNGHYTRGAGFYEQYRSDQDLADYGFPALVLPDTTLSTTDLVRRRWLDNHFFGSTFVLRWTPSINPPFFLRGPEFALGGGAHRYLGQHFGELTWASISTVPKDTRYYDNDADKTDVNLYGQMNMHWKGGLSSYVDLQVRQVRYNFDGIDQFLNPVDQQALLTFWNPKFGINWAVNDRWNTRLFYGVGNREPNRDDFTQSTPASRPRPERLRDLEAGIVRNSGKSLLSANLYYMHYRDQLVLDGRINDVGAYIRTNIPTSYRLGLELESQWHPSEWWSLFGNLALSRNRIPEFMEFLDVWDTGEQRAVTHRNTDIAFSPNAIGQAGATLHTLHRIPRHTLDFTLSGKYVGKQFLDNTNNPITALDAYGFADLRLNYSFRPAAGRHISLIASVQNLFDAQFVSNGWTYRFVSEGFDERPFNPYTRLEGNGVYNQTGYFPQAGRNWMLTVVVGM
jgi:iron complex outermembrane recepter protein